MTARTKSKSWQWTVWLCAALALLAVYVVLSQVLFKSVTWDLYAPRLHRLAIPLVVIFFYVAWNTRWDGVRREKKEKKVEVEGRGDGRGEAKFKVEVEERNLSSGAAAPLSAARAGRTPYQPSGEATSSSLQQKDESGAERRVHCQPQPPTSTSSQPPTSTSSQPPTSTSSQPPTSSLTGEELFEQARALPHQVVPDFDSDGPYLELLGQSAQKGYSPALAKLGEYAMRRAAWVEAYYWMKLAQRNGMHGLSPTLREIRRNWSMDGFPGQSSNVNRLFTLEAGSLGRALLHVDSGHEASKAKEYLKANHPEFLT